MDGKIYEHVGIECGTLENGAEAIGILYPTGIGEECDPRFMTLPCAKALLIDLRDAIQAAEDHLKETA